VENRWKRRKMRGAGLPVFSQGVRLERPALHHISGIELKHDANLRYVFRVAN
jgi:hypothetical protein